MVLITAQLSFFLHQGGHQTLGFAAVFYHAGKIVNDLGQRGGEGREYDIPQE